MLKKPKKVQGRNLQKKKSFKNKKILLILPLLVFAGVGIKLLFFASAAPNNCQYSICDINQGVAGGAGIDGMLTIGTEVETNVRNNAWVDQGVAFRAPNKVLNGSKAVYEFYRADITATEYAVEGTSFYNTMMASNNSTAAVQNKFVRKKLAFYAWPNAGTKDTMPVYKLCRDGWYLMNTYTTSKAYYDQVVASGNYWRGCGIAFYAYNTDYYAPEAATPNPATRKDTNCSTAKLTLGDRGTCVQWLKYIMKNDYKANVDTTTITFDAGLNNAVRFFMTLAKQKNAALPVYGNVVTSTVWNTLVGTRPNPFANPTPTPPTPTPNPLAGRQVKCIGDGVKGSRIQMVYLRAQSTPDRLPQFRETFQKSAVRMDSNVVASAKKTGAAKKIRWVHNADCTPKVIRVVIPDNKDTSATTAVIHMINTKAAGGMGFYNNDRKFLIYHDTKLTYCGLGGPLYLNTAKYPNNFKEKDPAKNTYNLYSGFGSFAPDCWGPVKARGDTANGDVQLHELWHALGAVNESAPRASYNGHCNDDQDVMCYDDRDYSSQPLTLKSNICPNSLNNMLLDCNNNDYFSANPPVGSYLRQNWNTYNSRFLTNPL